MDKRIFLKHYWIVAKNINNCITVEEYSRRSFYEVSYVRRLLRQGILKGLKIGGKWYVLPPGNK